jgi:hypothetical protein
MTFLDLFDTMLKSRGPDLEQLNINLKIMNKGIRRHRAIMRRIKLPDDLHAATTEGAWLKAYDCPLPTYIEGAAKGTHKLVDGSIYKLVLWGELEDRFYPLKTWWKRLWVGNWMNRSTGNFASTKGRMKRMKRMKRMYGRYYRLVGKQDEVVEA